MVTGRRFRNWKRLSGFRPDGYLGLGAPGKLGFSVPHDLAVAGFDHSEADTNSIFPLTTVDPSWTELGAATIRVLLDILEGKPVPEKTEVETSLVVARTCGCREKSISLAGGQGQKDHTLITGRKRIISEINRVLGKDRFLEPHGPAGNSSMLCWPERNTAKSFS